MSDTFDHEADAWADWDATLDEVVAQKKKIESLRKQIEDRDRIIAEKDGALKKARGVFWKSTDDDFDLAWTAVDMALALKPRREE